MSGPFYEAASERLAKARPDLRLDASALHAADLALHQERCAWRADWARCAARQLAAALVALVSAAFLAGAFIVPALASGGAG
jgi:hypothetical protein